ncbi:S9 family peptidase [Undibacterium sp. RTI2.1]|uniref:S9 family peptidase n=1 Tax=unclassified Undibacterium TaxID=2630295 RepID=UPI002AB40861|nr:MULTISPECIES: S9 family peptidase [unclassified Undibacterium]MDY7540340.1 S9 family peptidase [Undibacterium sp. 5I1]MEB0029948.1 S9 family peptidase [Undibacterium sp. RTI2.1]MEB0117088.1 S9 family peptidase [Undibacterium sp. RTI2.2]MEB0229972.1 S9 family peptidase [Undibacterium sp. 10I3]MEB0259509.1 S9 family peptidase [Undibacterium sp. 5I1]
MKLMRHAIKISTLSILLSAAFGFSALHAAPVAADTSKDSKDSKDQKPSKQARQATQNYKRYSIEQFMATTSINGASFSKDEKQILFNSNESGIFNAYTIAVQGGKPVALTKSSTDSTYAISYFYTDNRILFTRDKGGDENNHVYVRELDGSEKDLTPGDKLKAEFAGWINDGSGFYLISNERDPKYFDMYKYDAKTYARTLIYKSETGMNPDSISDDGKWIALGKTNTTSDSDIYLYNTVTRETKLITPHQGAAGHYIANFDPASKRLFYASNAGGEFTSIRTYDLTSGFTKEHEKADWDITGTSFSQDGRFRISVVNQDGSTVIRVVEGPSEKPVALPKLPGGEMRGTTFSASGNLMAFYVNGDRSPNNLYVHDFKTKQTHQLTQSLNKEINPDDLVEAEVVRFTSFDGTVIPSIFYKPKGASANTKVPAIVYVHGGPGGQTRRGYSSQIQYLVNHGYAVLGINNRGSSGYGKSFNTADDRKHGREPLWDCVEAKTYLASLGYIDPARIGIMGGSYGGYMTLAALAFRPETFKVGVDIFGVSNWLRTLESIPPYWEEQRKALYDEIGDPVKDKDFLIATSPLFHANEIRKPLMVIQGANDPRVLKAESDEIVDAVKKNKVPVEYVVFADEGHGFSKKKNQAESSERILQFLDKYLMPTGAAVPK